MLSCTCTLFVVAQWTTHLRAWQHALSADDVVSIITFLDIGAFLAFIPGVLYDALGCKIVGYVGALLSLGGYVCMDQLLKSDGGANVALLCFVGFVIGHGSIWLVVCALNTVTNNFEKQDRGRAVGLVMTTFGLSAGIYSSLIRVIEGTSIEPNLLGFFGISMGSISLVCVLGIAKMPPGHLLTARGARATHALGLCILALVLITLRALWTPQVHGLDVIAVVMTVLYVLVLAFQAFLVVRLFLRRGWSITFQHTMLEEASADGTAGALTAVSGEVDGSTFSEALRAVEYWLLLFVFLIGIGIGQNMVNSIGNIPGIDVATGVAIFAAGNAVGRFVPGYLSDLLFRHLDRMGFIIIATALLCVSQVVMLVSQQNPIGIYVGIFLTAAAFGSYWVLVPAVEAEWFGRLHFGKIHGLMLFLAGDGGVVALYKGLASFAESTRGPCDASSRVAGCFELKWLVCLALSGIAMLAAVAIRFQRGRVHCRESPRPHPSSMTTSLRTSVSIEAEGH